MTLDKQKAIEPEQEISVCDICDEPDFEGYHKAWCPMG